MTISSTTVKNSYSGNGTLDTFNYTFKIFADTDLEVIIRDATATETVKTLTTHYTVTGAGSASGGTIVFTSGNIPSATETVVIRRAVPQTQAIDYIANDPFPAESHEEGLDRAMMTLQQVQEELDRSIKLSRTNTMNNTEFTVGSTERADKVLAFDGSGELTVTQELGTFRGNWSSGTSFQERDLIKDTTNDNIYLANTAHTSSGSLPITTNADSAKWNLIVDAAAAATSASAAASSASAAATSETNAATSETNAATSESNAATSETNAATSEANAAASYDNFDDRYLGAKASDPSVDNDGDALIDGALYFDTTNNVLKVYDLGGTAWRRTTPTTSEQTNINTVSGISSDVTTVSGISSNVSTVAGISSNVTTVANNDANITTVANDLNEVTSEIDTVATNITNVNTVGDNISNVNTVAANDTNITTVAGNNTNVSTVATNISSVNTVATNITDVIKVADDLNEAVSEVETVANDLNEAVSEIDTVATSITNVDIVGNNISDVNTVAGISSNVTTVANDQTDIGTVASNISNVNTVAGIDTNVTAVAGSVSDIGVNATNIANINLVASNINNGIIDGILDYGSVADALSSSTDYGSL